MFRPPRGEEFRGKERVLRKGRLLRIEFSPGSPFAGQVIVEDGVKRLHYVPDKNEIRELPLIGDPFFTGFGFLRGGWDSGAKFEFVGNQEVASVPTEVFSLVSGAGKTLHKFWVDPKQGVILKRESMAPDGKVFAAVQYLAIKYNPPIPKGSFVIKAKGAKRVTLEDQVRSDAQKLGVRSLKLPPQLGWTLVGVRMIDRENMKILSQSYRKDRERITLFAIGGTVDSEKLKRLAGGRSRVHTWTADGASYAILGSLSEDELRALAGKLVART